MPPSLESLRELKYKTLRVIPHLCEAEGEDCQQYLKEYDSLLDQFYRENQDYLAEAQCRAARDDGEYFIRLIELAMAYYYDIVV
jgi:hypothetical protein